MACGTCTVEIKKKGKHIVGAPADGGVPGAPHTQQKSVSQAVSPAARRSLWQSAKLCQHCGGRYAGEPQCPSHSVLRICSQGVQWNGATIPVSELHASMISQAQSGVESEDGYLYLLCHFPGLKLEQNPSVRAMIRREVGRWPERALLGYAPDTLAQAGMGQLLAEAARAHPEAARASLRATVVLEAIDERNHTNL